MPKKSKKSRKLSRNDPEFQRRAAHLREIGMPSPYAGSSTSSSSLDDSSSSSSSNESVESSDNTGRLVRTDDDLSAVACHSADTGKIAAEDKSPDLTLTSSDTELQSHSKKREGVIREQRPSVIVKAPQSGVISESRNTSTTISSASFDQSCQNASSDHLGNESSNDSCIILLEKPPENSSKNISCATQAPKSPNLSESSETVEGNEKFSILRLLLTEGKKQEDENKGGLHKKHPEVGEANRKDEKNKTSDEGRKNLECSKEEPSAEHTAERDGMLEGVTLEKKIRTTLPTNLMTDASSSEGNIYKITPSTKCVTGISSNGRSKSVTPSKKEVSSKVRSKSVTPSKKEVSSKVRSKSVTPSKKEVSSKVRSKSVTPSKKEVSSKVRSKSVTPSKKEVSSKVRSKSVTPSKKEVSSKVRSKSVTPSKKEVSSKVRSKSVTPSKKEVSSKVRSKSVTPSKEVSSKVRSKSVTPSEKEVSSKERSKSVTPSEKEVSSKERSKSVTPSEKEVSSKERSKSVTPSEKEVSSKERSKSVTPSEKEVSSKERSKSVTPAKRSKEVPSKERSKSVTPAKRSKEVPSKEKSKSIALANVSPKASQEKFERTLSPSKYSSKATKKQTAISLKPNLAPSSREKRGKTVTSTTHTTESSTKEKTLTPTKYIPEVLSKEKLKSGTPTKGRYEVPVKERTRSLKPGQHKPNATSPEKCEKSCTPEATLKEETKTVTPVKHTSKDSSEKRSKTVTPTKRMPEASSDENRARSVTPSKRRPEVLSKGEAKYETQHKMTSVALSRDKFEIMTKTKCITKASTESEELTNTAAKNTRVASSPKKVRKPVTPNNFIEEKSCSKRVPKPVTPTKCTKGFTKESPVKHSRERAFQESERECETHVECTKSDINILSEDSNEDKYSDCREQDLVGFKETLGVDRVPLPEINFDVVDEVRGIYKDPENSAPNRSPEPKQQTRVGSHESLLEGITTTLDELKLSSSSNEVPSSNENIARTEPTSATEQSVPDLTIEEFRRGLGTDKISVERTNDDLGVINKALEKLEAERGRRVTFSTPSETGPSTSKERTSAERQLDTEPDFSREHTRSGGNLTFAEFHQGLSTDGYLKPEYISLDYFKEALERSERAASSQPVQEMHKDSCPKPLEGSEEPSTSDEDINKAIAASGMKRTLFSVVSSDEPTNSLKSDPSKTLNQPFVKIAESNLCAPGSTGQIPEEDSYLSESTSKSSEAIFEEFSGKSTQPDSVSSESVLKTSESETSPMEYLENAPEEEVESSESAVKSTESETSPEEHTGIHKESTELYEKNSDFERRQCSSKMRRDESSGSPEDEELKSPMKRRKSERLLAREKKSREVKPDFPNLGAFGKALEETKRTNSSQSNHEVHKDSCRPNPLEESKESDSSDEEVNKAIAASGMKSRLFRVIPDDEPKISPKSDPSKMLNQPLATIVESDLCAPGIARPIPEEDSNSSESTRKSSEASLGESSNKSSEPDLVSSESAVKSSESETSPMEYTEKSPEEEVESSESAVKSTGSEASPEEYTGDFQESTELHESEENSDFGKRSCEIQMGLNESPGSAENAQLRSSTGLRRSPRIKDQKLKSSGKQQRSRSQSENASRKRGSGDKDSKSKKKRYSDQH